MINLNLWAILKGMWIHYFAFIVYSYLFIYPSSMYRLYFFNKIRIQHSKFNGWVDLKSENLMYLYVVLTPETEIRLATKTL